MAIRDVFLGNHIISGYVVYCRALYKYENLQGIVLALWCYWCFMVACNTIREVVMPDDRWTKRSTYVTRPRTIRNADGCGGI
jgi:hypothetical protein